MRVKARCFFIFTLSTIISGYGIRDSGEKHLPSSKPELLPTTYTITLKTGCLENAGTDADVFIILFGTNGKSENRRLDTKHFNDRERCQTDYYRIHTDDDLGDLVLVRIWHNNANEKPGWFLEEVKVKNLRTGEIWNFPCGKWLALSAPDRQISRDFRPGRRCE